MVSLDHTEVRGIQYDLHKLGEEYIILTPFEGTSEIKGTIQSSSDEEAIKAFQKWAVYQFREFSTKF